MKNEVATAELFARVEEATGRSPTAAEAAIIEGLVDLVGRLVTAPVAEESIRLLKGPEVSRRTGVSRSKRYTLIEAGLFPSGRLIAGTRTRVWPESTITAWMAEQFTA